MTRFVLERGFECPRLAELELGADGHVTVAVVPLAYVAAMEAPGSATNLAAFLTEAELAVSRMHRMHGRRLAHLAGRVALKLALIDDARRRGVEIDALEVGVTQMMAGPEQGRPVVQLPARMSNYHASISHSQALAVAAVSPRGRVGIDVEWVAPRTSFVDDVFTPAEQVCLRRFAERGRRTIDEAWSLGWCIKEAMMKRTGHGMRDALHQVTFAGWSEHPQRQDLPQWMMEEPSAMARSISLDAPSAGSAPLPGFLALVHGYAWAILMDAADGGLRGRRWLDDHG